MNRKHGIIFVVLLVLALVSYADAYDNETTHKYITERVVKYYSNLDNYLKNNLGVSNGYKESIKDKQIVEWLMTGSYLEDVPDCRASNHFHNPLKPWDSSQMTDQPGWLDAMCFAWKPFVSNVTWATGYLARSPEGAKADLQLRYNAPVNWNAARFLYYQALTASTKEDREKYFADAFSAVGQVLHLLQDTSVPAHVRNDFTSHLIFNGISWTSPKKWLIQPYEKYVELNPDLITSATPVLPSFNTPVRLTDFWDTDTYTGSNPSAANTIGLAEFTNANYFSDSTIFNNYPRPDHQFPYPAITQSAYQLCEDYAPDSLIKRWYVSRKARTPVSETRATDHFAAVSLLSIPYSASNISNLTLWLDKNVHNTYAKELLPLAVGYSGALLDYFFRGELGINQAIPLFTDNVLTELTVKIRNYTSTKETMSNGYFGLAYEYTKTDGTKGYGKTPYVVGMNSLGVASLPYGKDEDGSDNDVEDLTVTFGALPPDISAAEYESARFTLAYFGDLGAEKALPPAGTGQIAVSGAVIGKVFKAGKMLFNEDWTQSPNGDHNWYQSPNEDPERGTKINTVGSNILAKENIRFASSSSARANTTYVSAGTPEHVEILPISISKDTYLEFKVNKLTINEVPPAASGRTNQWQGLWLEFTGGLMLQISLEGYFVHFGAATGYYTFTPAVPTYGNIHEMFQAYDIAIPDPLQLVGISFVQQLGDSEPDDKEYRQEMEVDYVRIIESKPEPLAAQ